MGRRAVITGAGHFVPKHVVTNDMLIGVVPEWGTADRIEEKLGIYERRFLWPLDVERRMTFPPPLGEPRTNTDMAELALRMALDNAGITGADLDALIFVTCTPDEPLFCHGAMMLHARCGGRPEAEVDEFNSGCGGSAYRLRLARWLIESGNCNRVALVAANATSPCFTDPGIYDVLTTPISENGKPLSMALSAYVFGDGAGAIILEGRDCEDHGIISSFAEVDEGTHVFRSGGGVMFPGNRAGVELWRHGYYVDGKKVMVDYFKYMEAAIRGALKGHEHELPDITRYYLHQVNANILRKFVAASPFPPERVPVHSDRLANTSAACTLILFSEDVHGGTITLGSGDLVLLAAMGAGVHYAGHLIRL